MGYGEDVACVVQISPERDRRSSFGGNSRGLAKARLHLLSAISEHEERREYLLHNVQMQTEMLPNAYTYADPSPIHVEIPSSEACVNV
jgi:hypothetical protein